MRIRSAPAKVRDVVRQRAHRATRTAVHQSFFRDLIQETDNFGHITWLGQPIWQNVLDLWVLQEAIAEIKPAVLLEAGTNRGGSALFYAHLFDLMGKGRVVTVDVEKMHDLEHPRIDFLVGSSVGDEVSAEMRKAAAEADGPVMVVLDSDHSESHVAAELEVYAPLVTPGSLILVQDGVVDTLPAFAWGRPGPLPAIEKFLARNPSFHVDPRLDQRFLISHHPSGWLRRK